LGTLNFKCPVEGPAKLKSAACNEILLLDQGQREAFTLLFARRMEMGYGFGLGETKKNICAKWFFW